MAHKSDGLTEIDKWAKRAHELTHETGMKYSYGDLQVLETVQLLRCQEHKDLHDFSKELGGLNLDERTRHIVYS